MGEREGEEKKKKRKKNPSKKLQNLEQAQERRRTDPRPTGVPGGLVQCRTHIRSNNKTGLAWLQPSAQCRARKREIEGKRGKITRYGTPLRPVDASWGCEGAQACTSPSCTGLRGGKGHGRVADLTSRGSRHQAERKGMETKHQHVAFTPIHYRVG